MPWTAPAALPEAIAFTSANGVALAGPQLDRFLALPAFAVGAATAAAARARGFADVRTAEGDASALFARASADGFGALLHLAGAERAEARIPAGLSVGLCTVYSSDPAPAFTQDSRAALAANLVDLVLLYSARTAAVFAELADRLGVDRRRLALAALSPAIAAAAGLGWRHVAVAHRPREDALFASAGLLCDKQTG